MPVWVPHPRAARRRSGRWFCCFVRHDELPDPGNLGGALLGGFFPGERDERGGDDEFENEAHGGSGLVVAAALGVEPVLLALVVGVIDVAGEFFRRRRTGRRRGFGLRSLGVRAQIVADAGGFAGPLFERFIPGERDQDAGDKEFEEKAHFRSENGGLRMEDGRGSGIER